MTVNEVRKNIESALLDAGAEPDNKGNYSCGVYADAVIRSGVLCDVWREAREWSAGSLEFQSDERLVSHIIDPARDRECPYPASSRDSKPVTPAVYDKLYAAFQAAGVDKAQLRAHYTETVISSGVLYDVWQESREWSANIIKRKSADNAAAHILNPAFDSECPYL